MSRIRCLLVLLGMLAVAACHHSPEEHWREAQAAVYRRDAHAALFEYQQVLDALEHDRAPSAYSLRARALKGAAEVYQWELHQPKEAIGLYRELVAACPDSAEALEGHVALASLLKLQLGDLRGAIAELAAAIAKGAPEADALSYQMAKLYFALGDYLQSAVEAQKLAASSPASPYADDAIFLSGQAWAMTNNRGRAVEAMDELVRAFPQSELVPHGLFESGKLFADAGDDEKAIERWVKSLKHHPDPALVQSHIARARARIAATTPRRIGDHADAFDKQAKRNVRLALARTSVEAAGGTREEASRDFGD